MAILLMTNGDHITVKAEEKKITLEQMYRVLECRLVETITLGPNKVMWFDEEGKLAGKELNQAATVLLHGAGGSPLDYIAGHALITDRKEVS